MKAALVTGASSGIGEATARRLGRDGWKLLLVARRGDRLEKLVGELPDASLLAVDLTEEDAPRQVAEAVEERLGRLDLLVNNAGSSERARFGDENGGYDNVRRVMDINFDAVLRLTEAVLPIVRRSAPSAIVNVSSIAGRIASPTTGAYNASKFALAGWTDALRSEEREHGVHVGLVLPGFVATEGFPQEKFVRSAKTRWMVGEPDQVADAIVRAGPNGKAEVCVPWFYAALPRIRFLAPGLVARLSARVRR